MGVKPVAKVINPLDSQVDKTVYRSPMRLVSYRTEDGWRAGVRIDSAVVDAAAAAAAGGIVRNGDADAWTSTRRILEQSHKSLATLLEAARGHAADGALADGVALGPPVPDPGKVICVGLNYRLHAEEFDGSEAPDAPNLFTKFATSLLGPGGTILLPQFTDSVDYEGELAVVIGRRCRNVSPEDALDHVAGAMAFNDVTARDLQARTSQWTSGKAIDTFAPCGPELVTLDEVGDIEALSLTTRLNGDVVQSASTAEMVFSVRTIVAYLSRLMTLLPGDTIATGTPHGVGFRREPPLFLSPGDTVEVEIEGIGCLTNQVARDDGALATGLEDALAHV
jgi:2-keto-4-pentenoate hydratase/2-oxohepta-3-ene-1,7-dioic acid hydratase in catechol pathway